METKTDKTVAIKIFRQLGQKARAMLGAKNFSCSANKLTFRIGGNCKKVNCITIELNALDLYDVQFIKIRGGNMTVLAECNNVYADMMHSIIETETGMQTSL